jgi:hypothetical protein
MTQQDDRGKSQARAQLDSIVGMIKRLSHFHSCKEGDGDEECELTDKELVEGMDEYWKEGRILTDEERKEYSEKYHDRYEAEQRIDEDPLSAEVRGDWHTPGETGEMVEYRILLCTGGPAVQIIGDLDDDGQPSSACLEYQDWGTPWTEFFDFKDDERDLLLAYAQHFYFGD